MRRLCLLTFGILMLRVTLAWSMAAAKACAMSGATRMSTVWTLTSPSLVADLPTMTNDWKPGQHQHGGYQPQRVWVLPWAHARAHAVICSPREWSTRAGCVKSRCGP